jgi:hypothetical protein
MKNDMKATHLFLAIGCILTTMALGNPQDDGYAAGYSGDTSMIKATTGQAEESWPRDVGNYSLSYRGIFKGLEAKMRTQPDVLSVDFLEHVVNPVLAKREHEPSGNSGALIDTQLRGTQLLLKAGNFPGISLEVRLRIAEECIGFFQTAQQQTIVNFTPKRVVTNVTPPDSGRAFRNPGMDPQDIEDPAARESYEKAIRVNRANAYLNSKQRVLADAVPSIRMSIAAFLKETAKRYPDAGNKIEAMQALISDPER